MTLFVVHIPTLKMMKITIFLLLKMTIIILRLNWRKSANFETFIPRFAHNRKFITTNFLARFAHKSYRIIVFIFFSNCLRHLQITICYAVSLSTIIWFQNEQSNVSLLSKHIHPSKDSRIARFCTKLIINFMEEDSIPPFQSQLFQIVL